MTFETESTAEVETSSSKAIALPKTVAQLIEQKKGKRQATLNDQVDQLHVLLWENQKYQAFLDAVYKEQAVEGDLKLDDAEAARMIRDEAKKQGNTYVAGQKLATIVNALNVVLRRYCISRRERRES